MYKFYSDKGKYINSTDEIGLVQVLKFMVSTIADITNIISAIKKSGTIILIDKFGNDWRIDFVGTP